MADQTLDCKGLNCPMPIIKISKLIKTMDVGQTVEVEATDPAFEADLRAWAKKLKHLILEFSQGDVLRAVVQKN